MIFNSRLHLKGEYAVDVVHADGTHSVYKGNNFITSTGLSMAMYYAFADCFRYVSLGSGNQRNSLTSNGGLGTTGLKTPLNQFAYIGGRGLVYDPDHATSQYMSASFREYNNSVALSRTWRIPPAPDAFDRPFTFKEFMLSPGKPYATGISSTASTAGLTLNAISNAPPNVSVTPNPAWTIDQWVGYFVEVTDGATPQLREITSNTSDTLYVTSSWDTTVGQTTVTIYPRFQLCYHDDYNPAYDYRDPYTPVYGSDCGAPAQEYDARGKPICSQIYAFSRFTGLFPVVKDDYMLLNYTLSIAVDSGSGSFAINVNRVGRTRGDLNNWYPTASGCGSLIHHGVRLVNPGDAVTTAPWGYGMPQGSPNWSVTSDMGESFIGSWGAPLEPSTQAANLSAYLSNDYLQFTVNGVDGGAGDPAKGYYFSKSGLMMWRSTPYAEASMTFPANCFNIRMPNATNGSENWSPCPKDYRTETNTQDAPDPACSDAAFPIIYGRTTRPAAIAAIEETAYNPWDRSRTMQRNFEFGGVPLSVQSPSFIKVHTRAAVLSWVESTIPGYDIPYYDAGFTDTGSFLVPTPGRWNGAPLAWHLDTGDNGNGKPPRWFYIEDDAKLTLWFNLSWGADYNVNDVDHF